jgi:hypothetical protein
MEYGRWNFECQPLNKTKHSKRNQKF